MGLHTIMVRPSLISLHMFTLVLPLYSHFAADPILGNPILLRYGVWSKLRLRFLIKVGCGQMMLRRIRTVAN